MKKIFMALLPFERLVIKTPLLEEQLLERLENSVEPARKFWWSWWGEANHKPYQGEIKGLRFTIWRIIYFRNSFLPIIRGQVLSKSGMCYVRITMLPSVLAFVFMGFWFVGIAFLAFEHITRLFSSAIQSGIYKQFLSGELLMPVAMFVLGYLLIWVPFRLEAVKSRAFFFKLFHADEIRDFDLHQLFRAA